MSAQTDDLKLRSKTINELVEMRADLVRLGYSTIAQEVTDELNARGYYDVPRLCSCFELAGDNPDCPVHRGEP